MMSDNFNYSFAGMKMRRTPESKQRNCGVAKITGPGQLLSDLCWKIEKNVALLAFI
jgi:hypothetical protein